MTHVRLWALFDRATAFQRPQLSDQFLSPKHLDCLAAIAEHLMPKRA